MLYCTGMGFNVNYEVNAAADAVMIVYELTKRVGNPTRRVRARGPTYLLRWQSGGSAVGRARRVSHSDTTYHDFGPLPRGAVFELACRPVRV